MIETAATGVDTPIVPCSCSVESDGRISFSTKDLKIYNDSFIATKLEG